MWNRIRPTSGLRRSESARAITALALVLLPGCNYTFQAGSGFPPHVQTLAVIPFENETDRFEMTQELHQLLLDELPRTFGVRTGSEEFAAGTDESNPEDATAEPLPRAMRGLADRPPE